MAQQEREMHSMDHLTDADPTKTEAPKGTVLILGLYATLIGILWGMMYFELILRR